jgi:hypothetical protein
LYAPVAGEAGAALSIQGLNLESRSRLARSTR